MKPNNLYYHNKGKWIPLPQWGQFFLELGCALATFDDSGKRIVVGLALPTRAYASSLISSGIVIGRLYSRKDNALERFQQLASLKIGTSLLYRKEGKRVKVSFQGVEEKEGNYWLKLDSGREIYKIPPHLALRLEFLSKPFTSVPKRASRKVSTATSPFLTSFLSQQTAKEVILQSHLDCMIIGSASRLETEVKGTSFAVMNSSGGFVEGTLQDILRVRRFSPSEAYRSDVYSIHGKDLIERQQDLSSVVIFDGASIFLKWKDCWPHSHLVVILDQTEQQFDAAIQAFNEDFIKSHLDEEVSFEVALELPKGVPLSIYQEMG